MMRNFSNYNSNVNVASEGDRNKFDDIKKRQQKRQSQISGDGGFMRK